MDKTIAYVAEAPNPSKMLSLASRLDHLASRGVGLLLLLSLPEGEDGLGELLSAANEHDVKVILDLSKTKNPRLSELAEHYFERGIDGFVVDSLIDPMKLRASLSPTGRLFLIGAGRKHTFPETKALLEGGYDMILDRGEKDITSPSELKEYLTQWQYHVDWNGVHLENYAAYKRAKKGERFSTMIGTLITSLKGVPFIPEGWADKKLFTEPSVRYLESIFELRNTIDALKFGDFCPIVANRETMAFYRVLGGVMILCIINLGKTTMRIPEQASRVEGEVLASNYGRRHYDPKGRLKPYEALIVKIK